MSKFIMKLNKSEIKISLNTITICLLFLLKIMKVNGHIGEPCNKLLNICLPVSLTSHVYCDSNNVCRCKKQYPVVVGPHTCLQPKKVSERCSHPEECLHSDVNSYCTQTSYSSRCECKEGFAFDKDINQCVAELKPRKPSNAALMIPTAAGFLMACFSLLCCCALIWHNICRKHDFTRTLPQFPNERTRRTRTQTNHELSLNRRNLTNIGLNESQVNSHLPPYESVLILQDEPPPSYEESCKMAATSSDTNTQTKA